MFQGLNEQGNVVSWECNGCGGPGIFDNSLACLREDYTCRTFPFPCAPGPNGGPSPAINPTDVIGGGSAGGSTNPRITLFDRLKSCDNTANGGLAAEGSDLAFCTAIRDLTQCAFYGGGISNTNLMALAKAPDCNPTPSPTDDEGSASEAATYVCSSGAPASMENQDAVEITNNYADYAAVNDFSDIVCFEEYLVIAEFLKQFMIESSVGEFIAKIDWNTSTDQEKLDKILKKLFFNIYMLRCRPDVDNDKKLRMDQLFTNLPLWIGGTTLSGTLPSLPTNVRLDFAGGGTCNSCTSSIPKERSMINMQAYDFNSCTSQGQVSVPCLTIFVENSDIGPFEDYLIRACN